MANRKVGRPRHRAWYVVLGLVAVLALAGVGVLVFGGGGSGSGSGQPAPSRATGVLQKAGAKPSKSARMVCRPEAAGDIASAIGVKTVEPLSPTWVDHQYSCRYVYPDGSMTLSVKELSSRSQTDAYFASLRDSMGEREQLTIGQGSFVTSNGSLVVRKDYKVLLVDTSGLPEQFGAPPAARSSVAVGVGMTVLGCWTGA